MANNNLVSINRLLSKINRDYGLTSSYWHNSAIEWIAEAIKEIGTIVPFENKTVTKTVHDYKLLMPCEFNLIIGMKDAMGCDIKPLLIANNSITNFETRSKVQPGTYKHYTVNGKYLNYSFTEEEVTIIYTDFVTDEDGYPMVVDSTENLEALGWYVMYKYLIAGNPHQTLNWKEAYAMWVKYRDKATNDINMPGPDNMEHIMSGWLGSFAKYNLNH